MLGTAKEPFKTIWAAAKESFLSIKRRITDYDIRRAQAKKIEAEASEKRARATSARKVGAAQAEVLEAKAEAIRTETRLKLIRELEARDIDWRAEVDEDGHLNIVVTKPKQLSKTDDPS